MMSQEIIEALINDLSNHAKEFDNHYAILDKDLNNFSGFVYHKLLAVYVNKYEDVVLPFDRYGNDLYQRPSVFVIDHDHQLDIIGVKMASWADDPVVLHKYYLQEVKGMDETQRELRFHIGRMEDIYHIWFKQYDHDPYILRYIDEYNIRRSRYIQM